MILSSSLSTTSKMLSDSLWNSGSIESWFWSMSGRTTDDFSPFLSTASSQTVCQMPVTRVYEHPSEWYREHCFPPVCFPERKLSFTWTTRLCVFPGVTKRVKSTEKEELPPQCSCTLSVNVNLGPIVYRTEVQEYLFILPVFRY